MITFLETKNVLFENMLKNMPGVFYRCQNDLSQTMLFISEGCFDLTGFSVDEFISRKINFSTLIHPEDKSRVIEKYNKDLEPNVTRNSEYRIICRQGRTRWIREISNGIYNSEGEILFITGYLQEITYEKETRLLIQALNSYQEAINSSSIVSITDKQGYIIYANDLFIFYSQYSREELVGKQHRIINSGHHPKEFFADLWQTISNGKIWRGEIKNKAKDGSFYWVDTVITPVFDKKNEVVQYLSIRNLITEKKNNEESLKTAYRSLINIEEEERLRFATQIHGQTSQNLAAAKMLLSKEIKNGNPQILEVYTLLDSVINDCYQLTSDSQENILSQNGLKGALETFITRLNNLAEIQITLHFPQVLNDELSSHTQFVLYRIIQEFLNIAINHVGIKKILITFSKWRKKVKILFTDNGKESKETISLQSKSIEYIRIRVAALNGTIQLETNKYKSNSYLIIIPCC